VENPTPAIAGQHGPDPRNPAQQVAENSFADRFVSGSYQGTTSHAADELAFATDTHQGMT